MPVTVNMPQLGETVTEGTILTWAKQPGESITEDEVLLEISTDKVDTEIPSPASGVIQEILVAEGETVSVGTPLVVIASDSEDAAPIAEPEPEPEVSTQPEAPGEPPPTVPEIQPMVAPEPAAAATAAPATAAPATDGVAGAAATGGASRRGVLSPVVRKLVTEHGLNLDLIQGSGSGGRITRKDVVMFIEAGGAGAPEAKVTLEPAPEPTMAADTVVSSAAPRPAAVAGDQVTELSRLRRTIATNMVSAKRTAAHVWTSVEVDFENVERARQSHRAAFKDREGFSLTYMPFVSSAAMDALRAYPVVNSSLSLEEGTVTLHSSIHLGIAVDLDEDGLIVATIRDADQLRMTGIAREVRRLALKARSGNIEFDDISPSTFTITNPGPFGSVMSAPIINVPNVAILSTDTVVKRPTVVTMADGSDAIAIRHIGYLGFSWDHRAFDGSTALLFLQRVRENLEGWDWEQELS